MHYADGVAFTARAWESPQPFIGAAVIRLELLELLRADTFSIVLGFSFVLLGVIAIAAYGMVRAIERLSR